ncbi:hypothetical protein WR25_04758 isoform B [Diploscapter pachys]|nr:hypothetical protein WR25_04758 isoform B [Diploscapter pachys]
MLSDTSSGGTCEMTVTCSNSNNRIAVRYGDRAACTRSNFNAFKFNCVAGKWSLNTATGFRPVTEIYCDGIEAAPPAPTTNVPPTPEPTDPPTEPPTEPPTTSSSEPSDPPVTDTEPPFPEDTTTEATTTSEATTVTTEQTTTETTTVSEETTTTSVCTNCLDSALTVQNNDPDNGSKDFDSDERSADCGTRTFTCTGNNAFIQFNTNLIIDDSEDPNVEIALLECGENGLFTYSKSGVTTTVNIIECYAF